MITLVNLTKTYGKRSSAFTALDAVNLTIESGATVAIVGKSGSGKSTLMHAMSGLDKPEVGQVIIDDQNILALRGKKLDSFRSRHIGFIFQSFFVQGAESCFHNVSLPLEIAGVARRKRRDLITAALTRVDLADKISSKARNLSGGQKQRLAIARAIVGEPSIIFADEPTGNLDSATSQTIEDLLFGLNKTSGVTLIVVTHDEELAARCNARVYIRDGKIERVEGKGASVPSRLGTRLARRGGTS